MLSILIMILFTLFYFRGVTVIPGGVPGVFDVTVSERCFKMLLFQSCY